jgi:hypothetical protein
MEVPAMSDPRYDYGTHSLGVWATDIPQGEGRPLISSHSIKEPDNKPTLTPPQNVLSDNKTGPTGSIVAELGKPGE